MTLSYVVQCIYVHLLSPHSDNLKNMRRRLSNTPTGLAERARIVWLWLGGASARSISQQIGTSLSVVYRWIHRWQDEGTIRTRPYHRRLRRVRWLGGHGMPLVRMTNQYHSTARVVHSRRPSLTSNSQPLPLLQVPQMTPISAAEKLHDLHISSVFPYLYSRVTQQYFH